MDQAGYTTVDSQAEITGSGPFDYKHIMQRKNIPGTKDDTYPNATNENLGINPGEILLYRKCNANMTTKSGAQKLAVFSSLNGMRVKGTYQHPQLCKRDLGFAGISKTLYTLPGASATSGSYQTDSGIAWLESGSKSADRNTGNQVIQAGSLIYLELPPLGMTTSPNNTGNGMPNTKMVMMTLPFSSFHCGSSIQAYSALFKISKSNHHTPGIVDLAFHELYRGAGPKRNGSAQEASAALFFGIVGICLSMQDSNIPLDAVKNSALKTGLGDRKNAYDAVNHVLLNSVHGYQERQVVLTKFKTTHQAAYQGDSLKPLNSTSNDEVKLAYLKRDALTHLFAAMADDAYETNRWIIGRAMHTAFPGQTLDIVVGDHCRPLSK
jgi:hypothetical protein